MTQRNPIKITEVMLAIQTIWERCPELRFWQLIAILKHHTNSYNLQDENHDLFYIEDDVFLKALYSLAETLE